MVLSGQFTKMHNMTARDQRNADLSPATCSAESLIHDQTDRDAMASGLLRYLDRNQSQRVIGEMGGDIGK